MTKRVKKLLAFFLALTMLCGSIPVNAAPVSVDGNSEAVAETTSEQESKSEETTETEVEKPTETTKKTEEVQTDKGTKTASVKNTASKKATEVENDNTYAIDIDSIDMSGINVMSIEPEEDIVIDENDPVIAAVEAEARDIEVLNEEGESVALTEEQIQTVLGIYQAYKNQRETNAHILGVQNPFYLQFNDDNEDGLGVLGEMLVLAKVKVDYVRQGLFSYDDLVGMLSSFYYADMIGIEIYGQDIEDKRDEAIKVVEDSNVKTDLQKMLVLNDWIAQNNVFDMAYIMNSGKEDPVMVAEDDADQKHPKYDDVHMYLVNIYKDQISKQYHDQIYDGVVAGLRQDFYEKAIIQQKQEEGATEEEAKQFVTDNKDAIQADPEQFVKDQFPEEVADQINAEAKNFIKMAEEEGIEVADGVKMTVENMTTQEIEKQADDAATQLTPIILNAWKGNHFGALAEGKSVCLGYASAFSYLVQCIYPEYYGKNGEGTDMTEPANWKTPEELYYTKDEDGNLKFDCPNLEDNYNVDIVRITYDTEVSMYGAPAENFGEVHFWNAVKIKDEDGNQNWYYVDPCYTDVYSACMDRQRVETDGYINHLYFMFSDTSARSMYDGHFNAEDEENGIKTLYKDKATDTTYEDSWVARVKSTASSDGDYFYYVYNSSDLIGMLNDFNNNQSGEDDIDFDETLYKLVRHKITKNDKGDGDTDFDTLIEFNYKENEDAEESVARVRNESNEMVENDLVTKLYAQHAEEAEIYPNLNITTVLYGDKLYFNLSNCILSYDLTECEVKLIKEYNKVYAKRDTTNPFGGMAFNVVDENADYDFVIENHPLTGLCIKDSELSVSVATNFAFISGKEPHTIADSESNGYGYEFEESNYNSNYNSYYSGNAQAESMGYDSEDNDNDEFMWVANFVDTLNMEHLAGNSHSYEKVSVDATCGRNTYTENRCTACGLIEEDSRIEEKETACEHHYVHFDEEYYTKDDDDNWNKGDCYVCTTCSFAISKPTEPTKSAQMTDEQYEQAKKNYEKEKAIYDQAVATAGHTYEPTDAKWSEDSTSVTFSSLKCSAKCPDRKELIDCLENDGTISVTLTEPFTAEASITGYEGDCIEGTKAVYTATGEVAGYKYTAINKVDQAAVEQHKYQGEFTWTEDIDEDGNKTGEYKAKANLICEICGNTHNDVEAEITKDDDSYEPTCTKSGKDILHAKATVVDENGTEIGSTEEIKEVETPATGHSYGEPEYVWSEDGSSCIAKFNCTKECGEDGMIQEVEAESITNDGKDKDFRCDVGGTINYTATFVFEGKTYSDELAVTVAPKEHEFEEPVFIWENHNCTATFSCKYGDKDESITKAGTKETVKVATCEENGEVKYTATFEFKGKKYSSSSEPESVEALGHVFDGKPVFNWTSDYKSCNAVFTCTRCKSEKEQHPCTITTKTVNATYTSSGTMTYVAIYGNYTDTKSVTIPQLDSQAQFANASYSLYSMQSGKLAMNTNYPDDAIIEISSSNDKALTVDTSGAMKAGKVTKTTDVTVTAKTASGKTITTKVVVKPAKVTLNAKSAPLQVKKSTTAIKIKSKSYSADKAVKWTSSNKKIATVNSKSGKITAKKTGNVTITVIMASGAKASCRVKVQKSAVKLTKLSVGSSKVTLYLKGKTKTYQIKPVKTPVTVTSKVTYKSSNTKVATVSKSGKITAKRKGKATITVKCSTKSKKITVTVKSRQKEKVKQQLQ